MHEITRTQSVAYESGVLVGVTLPEHDFREDPLDELAGLAEGAGVEVVGRLSQRREKPDAATYLGSGKVEELKQLSEATEAKVILFDNNLTPAQTRNLEKATGVKVLDRTELILDIFASRAQTLEARLAVELAQLEYSLPRLKRMWTHLERQAVGAGPGVGMRGPGEKQLEVDRRLAEKRIADLRRELDKVHQRRQREVASRRDVMTVSLVGYTNSGKSTLLNALTSADVLAADKLFATLETRTRRWSLPGWGPVLLSDTVGFVRDLPHNLVASFKATLEETRQADLLLHVADASNPAASDQIRAVLDVLEELGVEEKDTLLVLNKADQVENLLEIDRLKNRYPNAVTISAKSGDGLDRLAQAVGDILSRSFRDVDIEMSVTNGKLLAFLAAHGEVLSKQFHDNDRITVHCRIGERFLGQIDDS
ncbi:MAG: GTPase HflX, partial [Pirellulales bacterium]|nr:GTPase HflX [Pirellulales bacterium]